MQRSLLGLRALIALLFFSSLPPQARAGDLETGQRMKLLMRALAYDRQLPARQKGGTILVGVAFAPQDAASVKEKEAVLAALGALRSMRIAGFALDFAAVPYAGPSSIEAALGGRRAAALYVCGGLASAVGEIRARAAAAKIATMSGSEAITRSGLAFAAFEEGGGGRMIVNLGAAKEQGLDLDAALLKLSIVLKGGEPAPAPSGPVFQSAEAAKERRIAGSEPAYPNRALIQGWEATLSANVFISPSGKVERIEFTETDKRFEEAVRKAVAAWKFRPELVGGKPVPTYTNLRFAFKLD
jgi:TonB family protein